MTDDKTGAPSDKSQVGVTANGRETLEKLKGDLFHSEKAAFQAAIALALRLNLPPSADASFETKWGLGTMSEVLDFLTWYIPTDTPARYAEKIGDAGLAYVQSRLEVGRTVSEIFAPDEA